MAAGKVIMASPAAAVCGYSWNVFLPHTSEAHAELFLLTSFRLWQAYEGLETAKSLREEYLFIPAKVRELYLTHLLESLEDHKVR